MVRAALLVAAAASVFAQSSTPQTEAASPYAALVQGIRFRAIGPAMQGGRIDSLAVVEQSPDTFYVGTATSGVWKTTNGGTTFTPVFDDLPALTVGDIAVASSNPAIVWLGSGEANNRQSSSWGSGVYKSSDAGRTWRSMGLLDTQAIGRIAIDPKNPNIVYVAALGHLWGANAERGLFKTTDGGRTWAKVLFIDNETGVVDVAIDPRSPNIVYAAAYERRRTAWGFNGGGPGSAIYRSSDAGQSWQKLTVGLPTVGNLGRIGLAIYPLNPDIVYAVIEGRSGGVFRSDDQGDTWRQMGAGAGGSAYFSQIRIDPKNDLRVWVLLDFLMVSTDGGKSFRPDMRTAAHWDFHDLWIDPANSRHLLAATDGGIYRTRDAGVSWDFIDTLPIGQLYHIAYDWQTPYNLCGGFQDNGVVCGPVQTRSAEGISNADWRHVLTGDGLGVAIDPTDPRTIYAESQDGNLSRFDQRSHEWFPIVPKPAPGEAPYRFGWDAPLLISSHDAHTVYFAANFLFKSTDRGNRWIKLGPDLTSGRDRNTLPILGKTASRDVVSLNYGVAAYPAISAIAESPVDARVLWVGTQDGNVQVSRDGGETWTNVAAHVPDVPPGTWVSSLVASRTSSGAAYVAFDGHRSDDFRPYIFRTSDYGASWERLSEGMPTGGTVHVLCEDAANPDLLFAGSEYGAYVSFDRGARWQKLRSLPNIPVDDIVVHPRDHDLIIATHGRSIYVADDIRPMETASREVLRSKLRLFPIRPATSWRLFVSSNGYNGDRYFTAPNPPYGALISYYLQHDVPEAVIRIRDRAGNLIQQISGGKSAGLQRVNWDLRYKSENPPLDLQVWAAQQGFLIYHSLPNLGMPAPLVSPGEYSVEVSAAGETATATVEVRDDPNITINAADREAHDQLTMQAFQLYEQGMRLQRDMLALEAAVAATRDTWKKNGVVVPAAIDNAADTWMRQIEPLHSQFLGERTRDPRRPPSVPVIHDLAELLYSLEAHTTAPTEPQRERFAQLQKIVSTTSQRFQRVSGEDLAALNETIRQAGLPYIVARHSE